MTIKQLTNSNVIEINHPDQLPQILEEGMSRTIVLQLSSLTQNEVSYWEKKLTTEKNACGCGEGTAFLLVMLVSLTILIINESPLLPESAVIRIFLCTTLVFTSIGIGKSFGRNRAKQRLIKSICELHIILRKRDLYLH